MQAENLTLEFELQISETKKLDNIFKYGANNAKYDAKMIDKF